jgi:endogenous inhibitor of DNA gyrase (YacG/DUF329 family)
MRYILVNECIERTSVRPVASKGTGLKDSSVRFCSRRCKLVDLGKWLGEENRISEPLRADHLESEAPGNDQHSELEDK